MTTEQKDRKEFIFSGFGFEELSNAVVLQAVKDYRHLLVKEKEKQELLDEINKIRLMNGIVHKMSIPDRNKYAACIQSLNETRKKISEIERFFNEGYLKAWTDLDGPYLLKKVKAELISFNYNLSDLDKAHELRKG